MCALLVLVIFVLYYVEIVYKNGITTRKFSFCIKTLSKEIGSIVLVSCILLSGFSLHFFSERIKESTDNYINSYNYNSARARVNDYDVAGYENNEDYYNSIGVKSSADLTNNLASSLNGTILSTHSIGSEQLLLIKSSLLISSFISLFFKSISS